MRVKPPYDVYNTDIELIKKHADKQKISRAEWLRQAIRLKAQIDDLKNDYQEG